MTFKISKSGHFSKNYIFFCKNCDFYAFSLHSEILVQFSLILKNEEIHVPQPPFTHGTHAHGTRVHRKKMLEVCSYPSHALKGIKCHYYSLVRSEAYV